MSERKGDLRGVTESNGSEDSLGQNLHTYIYTHISTCVIIIKRPSHGKLDLIMIMIMTMTMTMILILMLIMRR